MIKIKFWNYYVLIIIYYTVRAELTRCKAFSSLYDLEKNCPFLPEVRNEEEIFKRIKDAVGKATETVIS